MRIPIVLAAALFAVPAFAQESKEVKETPQKAKSAAPTDPQIAHIAATAHQIDIARGKLALKKTKNAEVKQFAQQMVDDHTAGLNEALALVKRLGVTPEKNATSKSLQDGANKATARLKKESGAKFDKDYIDTEVDYHKAVIDAVKNADAVYTDVWTSMGQEDEAELRREAFAGFCVDETLMAATGNDALFLHCLPAHRGEEVSAAVIDGPRSRVWQQAANRMHAARALLPELLES